MNEHGRRPRAILESQVIQLMLAVGFMAFAAVTPAAAHEGEGVIGGFASGFMHPILGWDHVAAMVAVGLWGAFLGAPAIWLLPIVFPLVMALGGGLGTTGVPIPGVEAGIAASAVVLGIMVALGARPPLWVAAVIVGAFAIFHGHACAIRAKVGSESDRRWAVNPIEAGQ